MDAPFLENEVEPAAEGVRLFREWIADDTAEADPKELAGHLWREGEIALLVGEPGAGKSILAVEIADRISQSYEGKPLDCTVEPTNVLYVDLEMDARQLRRRYSYELDPGETREDYEFTERLYRLPVNPLKMIARRTPEETAAAFVTEISKAARECEARVIVIDSITALKRSYYGTTDLLPIIRRIRHLAQRRGLSILMLATIPGREADRAVSLRDLGGLRLAASCVDTVFAIAKSGVVANERYIKHLTSRNSQVVYDANSVLRYELNLSGNFLGLEFKGFDCESCLLSSGQKVHTDGEIAEIISLRREGRTIRDIALEVGRSKTTVGRLLQRYYCSGEPHPDEDDTEAPNFAEILIRAAEDLTPEEPATEPFEDATQEPRADSEETIETPEERLIPYEFPGCEEYEKALRDPRLVVEKGMKRKDAKLLRRERSIIEAAATTANRSYKEKGLKMRLKDHPRLTAFRTDHGIGFEDSG